MSYQEEVLNTIKSSDDLNEAASAIFTGPKQITLYVLLIGLQTIARKNRAHRRRELRAEIRPILRSAMATGSADIDENFVNKMLKRTKELFGDDGWMIGDINLGDFTKESLIAQAQSERKSAAGLIWNAEFYEALSQPLNPGQLVREFWTPRGVKELREGFKKRGEGRPSV